MVHVDPFQTLADSTRRLIVEALQGSEQSVNDIVARVGIHQSGVSRHLRILHEAGFVHWETRLDKFAEALGRKQRTRRRKPGP